MMNFLNMTDARELLENNKNKEAVRTARNLLNNECQKHSKWSVGTTLSFLEFQARKKETVTSGGAVPLAAKKDEAATEQARTRTYTKISF